MKSKKNKQSPPSAPVGFFSFSSKNKMAPKKKRGKENNDDKDAVPVQPVTKKKKPSGGSSSRSKGKGKDTATTPSIEEDELEYVWEDKADEEEKQVDPANGNESEKFQPFSVDPTAMQFFKNQQYGSRGIKGELRRSSQLESLKLESSTYNPLYQNMASLDPLQEVYVAGRRLPRETALRWLWHSVANANIFLYGVGDKRPLLSDFAAHYLQGEDVLELNGNPNPSHSGDTHPQLWRKSVRAVLDTIAETFLKANPQDLAALHRNDLITYSTLIAERLSVHYGRVSTLSTQPGGVVIMAGASERRTARTIANPSAPKYGRRYAHAQARLYLVVHELCGPCFDHPDAQKCLSILANCDSLTLFASVEILNIGLHWDAQTLARFHWRYYHIPTYVHHRVPADHPLLLSSAMELTSLSSKKVKGDSNTGQALIVLLDSLTHNHRDFLRRFCAELVRKHEGGTKQSLAREMPLTAALSIATNALLVRNKAELKKLLMEFVDHRVFQLYEDNHQEHLRVLLSDHDIMRLSNMPAPSK